ncbi:hypothetical protein [Nostoc sp.]|uniref:hypothetical protein n=1 Tax=Nostoc sp. TaxID=1180 RepID=UPI002FFB5E70
MLSHNFVDPHFFMVFGLQQFDIPLLSLSGRAISRSFISQAIRAILITKTWLLYLLLGKNLAMPAAGYAYASYTKALEFRNGKSFRRVTEEGYTMDGIAGQIQCPYP